jgi:hypothetical protein
MIREPAEVVTMLSETVVMERVRRIVATTPVVMTITMMPQMHKTSHIPAEWHLKESEIPATKGLVSGIILFDIGVEGTGPVGIVGTIGTAGTLPLLLGIPALRHQDIGTTRRNRAVSPHGKRPDLMREKRWNVHYRRPLLG